MWNRVPGEFGIMVYGQVAFMLPSPVLILDLTGNAVKLCRAYS